MAQDDSRRGRLRQLLVPVLGTEATVELLDSLPPPSQLLALERRMDDRFTVVDQRFTVVDQRFDAMDQRFDAMDQRFTHLEQRIDDRIDGLRGELLAAFRGELVTAVSGQTRHVITAVATSMFGLAGLALALARLVG